LTQPEKGSGGASLLTKVKLEEETLPQFKTSAKAKALEVVVLSSTQQQADKVAAAVVPPRERVTNLKAVPKVAVAEDSKEAQVAGEEAGKKSDDLVVFGQRERLVAFYTKYEPSNLGKVDTFLAKYKGKEELLWRRLEAKYGPEDKASSGSMAGKEKEQEEEEAEPPPDCFALELEEDSEEEGEGEN
jgi:hypothetical protein